jgi:argininosuccinate lyase
VATTGLTIAEGLFPAIQNLKACLDIAIFSIKDIKVKNNILADKNTIIYLL